MSRRIMKHKNNRFSVISTCTLCFLERFFACSVGSMMVVWWGSVTQSHSPVGYQPMGLMTFRELQRHGTSQADSWTGSCIEECFICMVGCLLACSRNEEPQ